VTAGPIAPRSWLALTTSPAPFHTENRRKLQCRVAAVGILWIACLFNAQNADAHHVMLATKPAARNSSRRSTISNSVQKLELSGLPMEAPSPANRRSNGR
jgi:hypothetical protein